MSFILLISAIIFPGLYHYFFGIYPVQLETPFEFGHNAYLLIGSNAVLFGFGLIYYKNKFSLLNSKIDQIRKFEISKKISIVILIIILSTYAGFSIPELFLDEREQWGDYFYLKTQ